MHRVAVIAFFQGVILASLPVLLVGENTLFCTKGNAVQGLQNRRADKFRAILDACIAFQSGRPSKVTISLFFGRWKDPILSGEHIGGYILG
jgi:hypothetical protein